MSLPVQTPVGHSRAVGALLTLVAIHVSPMQLAVGVGVCPQLVVTQHPTARTTIKVFSRREDITCRGPMLRPTQENGRHDPPKARIMSRLFPHCLTATLRRTNSYRDLRSRPVTIQPLNLLTCQQPFAFIRV